MARFAVFVGQDNYPYGGWQDFAGFAATLEVSSQDAHEAWRLASELRPSGLSLRVLVNHDWPAGETWCLWAPFWHHDFSDWARAPRFEREAK